MSNYKSCRGNDYGWTINSTMQAIFDNHGFNETTIGVGPPDSSGNPTSIKYDHTPNINSNNPTTSGYYNLYNIYHKTLTVRYLYIIFI